MNWDYLLESALADVAALLNPCSAAAAPAPPSSASSGLGDSRFDGTVSTAHRCTVTRQDYLLESAPQTDEWLHLTRGKRT